MVRTRLVRLVLAAGLGLSGGCSGFSGFGLCHRGTTCTAEAAGCCDLGESCSEGPLLGEAAPVPVSPAPVPAPAQPPIMPQPVMPPLATPPRVTPQPESQPTPYTPTRKQREL